MVRREYIRIYVNTYDGLTLKLDIEKDSSIRDLKGKLCHEHGYVSGQHQLMHENGVPLEELLAFQHCGVNNDCTLRLEQQLEGGAKRRPSKELQRVARKGPSKNAATLDPLRALELQEQQEEAASRTSTLGARSSEEELAAPIKSSMSCCGMSAKALPSVGCHAKEPFAVQIVRREARKLTKQKATDSHTEKESTKQPAQPDLATMVSVVFQNMFPDLFVGCNPSLAKKPSWGGA